MFSLGHRFRRISSIFLVLVFTYVYLFFIRKPHYTQIPNYAPLKKADHSSRVAIVTFLSGGQHPSAQDDFYYQAARTLTYQLLRDPKTRSRRADIPFLVLCTQDVPVSKLQRLELDGATVRVVADIPLPYWISTGVRWLLGVKLCISAVLWAEKLSLEFLCWNPICSRNSLTSFGDIQNSQANSYDLAGNEMERPIY